MTIMIPHYSPPTGRDEEGRKRCNEAKVLTQEEILRSFVAFQKSPLECEILYLPSCPLKSPGILLADPPKDDLGLHQEMIKVCSKSRLLVNFC